MNAGSKYDMVLMDIIMPNLDGVSACHLIRQFDNTPIIAMTSNIRSDDISMYFQHGRHLRLRVASEEADCDRDERCVAKAVHQGGSPEYAGKASWPSEENAERDGGHGTSLCIVYTAVSSAIAQR